MPLTKKVTLMVRVDKALWHGQVNTYLHTAFNKKTMRKLVQSHRSALTRQVDLIFKHNVRGAAALVSVSIHQHCLHRGPVVQYPLQRSPAEARRLQVVFRHLGVDVADRCFPGRSGAVSRCRTVLSLLVQLSPDGLYQEQQYVLSSATLQQSSLSL